MIDDFKLTFSQLKFEPVTLDVLFFYCRRFFDENFMLHVKRVNGGNEYVDDTFMVLRAYIKHFFFLFLFDLQSHEGKHLDDVTVAMFLQKPWFRYFLSVFDLDLNDEDMLSMFYGMTVEPFYEIAEDLGIAKDFVYGVFFLILLRLYLYLYIFIMILITLLLRMSWLCLALLSQFMNKWIIFAIPRLRLGQGLLKFWKILICDPKLVQALIFVQ